MVNLQGISDDYLSKQYSCAIKCAKHPSIIFSRTESLICLSSIVATSVFCLAKVMVLGSFFALSAIAQNQFREADRIITQITDLFSKAIEYLLSSLVYIPLVLIDPQFLVAQPSTAALIPTPSKPIVVIDPYDKEKYGNAWEEVDLVQEGLASPVTYLPLRYAVKLPCKHLINLNDLVPPKPCYVCRSMVSAVTPDQPTRDKVRVLIAEKFRVATHLPKFSIDKASLKVTRGEFSINLTASDSELKGYRVAKLPLKDVFFGLQLTGLFEGLSKELASRSVKLNEIQKTLVSESIKLGMEKLLNEGLSYKIQHKINAAH